MQWQYRSFILVFYDSQDIARVMSSTRGTSRFGDGPMTESNIHVRRVGNQNFECVRKAHRRVPSWCQRLARAELRTGQRFYIGELPDSPDSSVYALSINESDEDDFDYGALVDPADQRDPDRFISHKNNHGRMDHINHGEVIGKMKGGGHSQDLWNPSECHNWVATTDQTRCPMNKSQQCPNVQETWTLRMYRRSPSHYPGFCLLHRNGRSKTMKDDGRNEDCPGNTVRGNPMQSTDSPPTENKGQSSSSSSWRPPRM